MNEKEKRAVWLAKLKKLQKQLDTGRGVIFGRSFSEEHDQLVEAIDTAALVLEGYYEEDKLSEAQAEQLKNALNGVYDRAKEYIKKKKDTDKYSLDGEGENIKKAKGDKRTRLEAAAELQNETALMANEAEAIMAAAGQEEQENMLHVNVGRKAVSLGELREKEKETGYLKDIQAGVIASKHDIEAQKAEYKEAIAETAYKAGSFKDLEGGCKLHRGDILGFNTDEGFKKCYDKYRMKIFKSVETYRALEELRDTNRLQFKQALADMHMTEKVFREMSDKINVIELQGEYLDVRASVVSNPAYVSMTEDEQKALKNMNDEELLAEKNKLPANDDPETVNRKNLIEDMRKLKGMAAYSVSELAQSTEKRANFKEDKTEGKHLSTKISFGTAYGDVGGKKRSFKEYFSSKKFGAKYSDATVAYDNGVKEGADFLNLNTGVLKGKCRLAKIGGKIKSEHGSLQAGAHVTAGTVKTASSVGVAFSASKLWENKVYATASATAYGVRGVAKASGGYRKDWIKLDGKAEGNIGSATAIAQGGAGMIRYTDDKGKEHEGFGVAADLTAAAALYEGSIGGGITIFGVRFGGKVSGAAVAAGVKSRFAATGNVLSFGLSAALGLGVGFEVSIDITGLKEKYKNWRNRGKQKQQLREKKAQERLDKLDKKQIEKEFEVIEKENGPKNANGPARK